MFRDRNFFFSQQITNGVAVAVRLQIFHELFHAALFKLEHRVGIAGRNQLIRFGNVVPYLVKVYVYAVIFLDILSNIIRRSASILDVPCSVRAASEIASRSRGTPRIANALLRRVRDFAQVKGTGSIDTGIAQFALEALNIDKYGLDEIDNKILCTIIDKFKGGPVGITTIATALGEDAGTIEEVYEPFLIKEGFMKRTPRGREVTELAYKHLGRSLYNSQKTLFND